MVLRLRCGSLGMRATSYTIKMDYALLILESIHKWLIYGWTLTSLGKYTGRAEDEMTVKKLTVHKRVIYIPTILACFFLALQVFANTSQPKNNTQSIKMPLADKSLLMDITSIDDSRLVAIGEYGHILLSDDDGRTFRQVNVPTKTTLTAVYFFDRNHGWAVGHDSTIIFSEDAGENWILQFFDLELEQPFMDVYFLSSMHGMAVGAYGILMETIDGGKTWENRYFESLDDPEFGLPHFNVIRQASSGELYMAGEAGFIAQSLDMGKSWQQLERPYDGSYFTLLITKSNTLIAAGLRGNIFCSQDSGANWTRVLSESHELIDDSLQLADGTIILLGLSGTILTSHDDGHSFRLRQQPDRLAISASLSTGSGHLIITGEGGIKRILIKDI